MSNDESRGSGMSSDEQSADAELFQEHRAEMLAHAYRMLGDLQRAEDIVQEVWLRWRSRKVDVDQPKAYLLKVTTRLCLTELGSARARRERLPNQLPEPVDLQSNGFGRLESLDTLSMAFMVLLQKLSPLERAVLLLHEVFGYTHEEIADFLGRGVDGCRQALRRARHNIAVDKRPLDVSDEQHQKLLVAFVRASTGGDKDALLQLLTPEATLVVDAGDAERRFGGARNLPGPLQGARKIAAFVASVTPRGATGVSLQHCRINGSPAVAVVDGERLTSALSIELDGDRIRRIFVYADPSRLTHLGQLTLLDEVGSAG